jgi:hypothetical protein
MQVRRSFRAFPPLAAVVMALTACGGGGTPTVEPTIPPIVIASPPPVTTPSPTIDQETDPRIDGTYDVVKKVTSVRHFTGLAVGDILHRTYRVSPSCPIGPCGGAVVIHLAESATTLRRRLAYDAATRTYTFVPVASPVTCTGVDGRHYTLRHTTDTVLITPAKTASTGVDVVATTWTATEMLKAVPDGKALNRGHCRTTVIGYRYTATLKGDTS